MSRSTNIERAPSIQEQYAVLRRCASIVRNVRDRKRHQRKSPSRRLDPFRLYQLLPALAAVVWKQPSALPGLIHPCLRCLTSTAFKKHAHQLRRFHHRLSASLMGKVFARSSTPRLPPARPYRHIAILMSGNRLRGEHPRQRTWHCLPYAMICFKRLSRKAAAGVLLTSNCLSPRTPNSILSTQRISLSHMVAKTHSKNNWSLKTSGYFSLVCGPHGVCRHHRVGDRVG